MTKSRSAAACEFCHRRKLRCSGQKPSCTTCTARGITCVYADRAKRARPSNARIHQLEAENARLRSLVGERQTDADVYPAPDDEGDESDASTASHAYPSGIPCRPPVRGPCRPPTAVHDDHDDDGDTEADERARDQLLAQATRQRMLEPLHASQGKLHVDGLPPDTVMRILSAFWARPSQHGGLIVYRPAFMRDMAMGGAYFSQPLLFAVLFAGAQQLKQTQQGDAGQDLGSDRIAAFRRRFEDLVFRDPSAPPIPPRSITAAQALLVVSDALFQSADDAAASWHYLGLAVNILLDLGLYTETTVHRSLRPANLTPEDFEIRRRLLWSAYVMDKAQSLYLGHPSRLRETDIGVPLKFLDEYQELEPLQDTSSSSSSAPARPSYAISSFTQLCRLSRIVDRVFLRLYAENLPSRDAPDLLAAADALHADLDAWMAGMPPHLLVDLDKPDVATVLPNTLSLMAMHHATGILLYRPFISEGHLPAPSDRRTARRALSRCAAASLAIDRVLRLYTAHLDVAQAPYFISYAAYASATFHVRAAARASTAGGVGAAHGYLRTCLDVLGAQAGFGRAPARTLRILRGLMKRLGVRLDAAKTTAALPAAPAAVVADGGVHVPTPSSPPALPDFDVLYTGFDDMAMPDVDMDQLMRTFAVDPWPQADLEPPQGLDGQPFGITPAASADGYVPPVADDLFFPDLLFGFDFDMGLPDAER